MPKPAPCSPGPRPFTTRLLEGLKPKATVYEVFDPSTRALALRVSPTGVKAWRLYYRQHGKLRRVTLGHFPKVGLAKARTRAQNQKADIFDGVDPVQDRQADRASWDETVGALITAYFATPTVQRQRSWVEKARALRRDIRPLWGDRRAQDITRREVRELVEQKARHAPIMANRLLAHINTLFNFALDREWVTANPAARITPPGAETPRERVLSREEIRALWQTLVMPDPAAYVAAKVTVPAVVEREAFLVLLLTGQRLTETCQMRWPEVDLDAGWWTIPGRETKNAQPHRVFLSAPVPRPLEAAVHQSESR